MAEQLDSIPGGVPLPSANEAITPSPPRRTGAVTSSQVRLPDTLPHLPAAGGGPESVQAALRARLEAHSVADSAGTGSFVRRLARENGWTLAYAARVIREYKRFIFLALTAGHPVT